MLHLCDLKNDMDFLKSCKITTFDDLLKFLNNFDEFKKEVTTEYLSKNATDKLFICIRLVKTNLDRGIFTAVTTKKLWLNYVC